MVERQNWPKFREVSENWFFDSYVSVKDGFYHAHFVTPVTSNYYRWKDKPGTIYDLKFDHKTVIWHHDFSNLKPGYCYIIKIRGETVTEIFYRTTRD